MARARAVPITDYHQAPFYFRTLSKGSKSNSEISRFIEVIKASLFYLLSKLLGGAFGILDSLAKALTILATLARSFDSTEDS